MPALAKQPSTRPKVSSVAAIADFTEAGSLTSQIRVSTLPGMLGGLGEALDAIDDRKAEVRCLVITGAGRAFCTGANLQGRGNTKPGGRSNAGAALETAYHPFLRRLRNLHCPIVTSVNGPAAGAGMSIALMGDMILCARSSYFLQAFRRIGLVPDCGSTWRLPRLVGKTRSVG